jgi:hypothetical protein
MTPRLFWHTFHFNVYAAILWLDLFSKDQLKPNDGADSVARCLHRGYNKLTYLLFTYYCINKPLLLEFYLVIFISYRVNY